MVYYKPDPVVDLASNIEASVSKFIRSYQDLNSPVVDELAEQPTPLEFMRYVARNRPFVVRGGIKNWKAVRDWNVHYLKRAMEQRQVNIAHTPNGRADAVTVRSEDGKKYFVKPFERERDFNVFLDHVRDQEKSSAKGIVQYAQTQNDNLRGEYADLFKDVPPDISWARIALCCKPDAVNLWLGNSKSVSVLHRDNYENMYCQIIGVKHFVLLPPVEHPCVNERKMESATYVEKDGGLAIESDHNDGLDNEGIPCPLWDPDDPKNYRTQFSELSKPLRVDLNPGDMLYLPALWFHKVSQSCSEEGICCAVNYWYDMNFDGQMASSISFLQDITTIVETS